MNQDQAIPVALGLQGFRVLVAEDQLLIADTIVQALEDEGCVIVGPVPRVAEAVALASDERLDGALLDMKLSRERCFPIAEALAARDVPFAFLTGYGESALPPAWQAVPRLSKPLDFSALVQLASQLFRRHT